MKSDLYSEGLYIGICALPAKAFKSNYCVFSTRILICQLKFQRPKVHSRFNESPNLTHLKNLNQEIRRLGKSKGTI